MDDVPLGTANTLVMRIGDWVGWLSLAGFVFFMVYMEKDKKNHKQAPVQVDNAS